MIIKEKKQQITVEDLCADLPMQFLNYMKYCRKLKFEEKPDYAELKIMFKNLFYEKHYDSNFGFDWVFLDALNKVEVPVSINTNGTNQASISGTNLPDGGYQKLVIKHLDRVHNSQSIMLLINKSTQDPENSKAVLDSDIEKIIEESKGEKTIEISECQHSFLPNVLYKQQEIVDSSSCDFKDSEIIENKKMLSKL
jgi:hypothetical protein